VNYAELSAALISWTEDTSDAFAAEIPVFVEQVEQIVYQAIDFPALRKNVTGNVTANNKYLTMPTDFISVFSLAVILPTGEYQYLLNKDVNFIREAYPTPTTTGVPKFYGLFDANTTILGPTPTSSYDMELHYSYYPESLVTAGTTWLSNTYDPVYLYGCLMLSAIWHKGEQDLIKNYDDRFNAAMEEAKQLGDGKLRQDVYRSNQYRQAVK